MIRSRAQSRGSSRRRRAQLQCAVCPQAFWMRCLYMPLVRLALPLQYETWIRAKSWAMMSQVWRVFLPPPSLGGLDLKRDKKAPARAQ